MYSFLERKNGVNNFFVCSPAVEEAADDYDEDCDDIIGQSLMLAHNAIHSLSEQPSMLDSPCQRSQDKQSPVQTQYDDHSTRSHDLHGSHDQHEPHDHQMNSHELHVASNAETCNTAGVVTNTNIPSKMTFIDWTEIRRKDVTPTYYPKTPIPINVQLDQDRADTVLNSKKKKMDTNPTVSKTQIIISFDVVLLCMGY